MSTEAANRCGVCFAYLDEEDLFCANCGAEAPPSSIAAQPIGAEVAKQCFSCRGCGASMSYDASAQTLRCPFCGSDRLEEDGDQKTLSANRVLPFAVGQNQALQALREWLGNGFWKPSDLVAQAKITKLAAVYVPYWIFEANTQTYWTADSSRTPPRARGDWVPHFGSHAGRYHGILVGASGALTPKETSAVCPFDISQAVPRDHIDLENQIVERFVVQRKYARPAARHLIEAHERDACHKYVPGRARNVKVNTLLHGMASEPVLLPIWIMAYRYREEVYRFVINGQSGKHVGNAPFSYKKLLLVLGGLTLAGGLLLLILVFLGALGA